MRIVFISDTHDRQEGLTLPEGDLLVHTGDFTMSGRADEAHRFLDWYGSLPHPHKVFIAGNHDFIVERDNAAFRSWLPEGVTYLENEEAEVGGLRIYGSPVTPWFHDWAFMEHRGEPIDAHWQRIPTGLDLLLTHGPPRSVLDRTIRGEPVGCDDLARRVREIQPRVHAFGHIHESRGELREGGTLYVNACVLDRRYNLAHKAIVIEL